MNKTGMNRGFKDVKPVAEGGIAEGLTGVEIKGEGSGGSGGDGERNQRAGPREKALLGVGSGSEGSDGWRRRGTGADGSVEEGPGGEAREPGGEEAHGG